MTKILLHIGRHKTGTTSLQYFLYKNRDVLRRRGFIYPPVLIRDRAHHPISQAFQASIGAATGGAALTLDEVDQALMPARQRADRTGATIVLSSEAFQNIDPRIIVEHFAGDQVAVIVYIREQCSYMVSAYQQSVHQGAEIRPLWSAMLDFNPNYDAFLKSWEKVVGRDNIKLRLFTKSELVGADVTADFLDALTLGPIEDFAPADGDRNPSIGGPALELKRILNAVMPVDKMVRGIYGAFSALAAMQPEYRQSPGLTDRQIDEIEGFYSSSNEAVKQRYFENRDRPLFPSVSRPGRDGSRGTLTIEALLTAMTDLSSISPEISMDFVNALLIQSGAHSEGTSVSVEGIAQSISSGPIRQALAQAFRKIGQRELLPGWAWNFDLQSSRRARAA